jgi:hypothetical protein
VRLQRTPRVADYEGADEVGECINVDAVSAPHALHVRVSEDEQRFAPTIGRVALLSSRTTGNFI